jgi:uncharacterized YccA/Bax inhibitor family protein
MLYSLPRYRKGNIRQSAPPCLPDANTIWWRAQLRNRLAMEERVRRPLRIAERLACTACLLAVAVLSALLTWGRILVASTTGKRFPHLPPHCAIL